jgi:hypothetical protein
MLWHPPGAGDEETGCRWRKRCHSRDARLPPGSSPVALDAPGGRSEDGSPGSRPIGQRHMCRPACIGTRTPTGPTRQQQQTPQLFDPWLGRRERVTAATSTGSGWCPGIRPPGCSGTHGGTAGGCPAECAAVRSRTAAGRRNRRRSARAGVPGRRHTGRGHAYRRNRCPRAGVMRSGVRPRSFQRWIAPTAPGGPSASHRRVRPP